MNTPESLHRLHLLRHFIGHSQRAALAEALHGEESPHFEQTIKTIAAGIANMPRPYGTRGQGDNALVVLHYFRGACDWWITERDSTDEQLQAFGLASLGYEPELGYISIHELLRAGVELDLYWHPVTIGEVRAHHRPAFAA